MFVGIPLRFDSDTGEQVPCEQEIAPGMMVGETIEYLFAPPMSLLCLKYDFERTQVLCRTQEQVTISGWVLVTPQEVNTVYPDVNLEM